MAGTSPSLQLIWPPPPLWACPMPFYRINGQPVHMRGSKLPPACVAAVGLALSGQGPCHAQPVGKNKHYCPEHFGQHKDASRQLGLFTSLVQK